MGNKLVHNISNHRLTKANPSCITIGGQKIRPGKFVALPEESLTRKVWALHGTAIWIGSLPKKLEEQEEQAVSSENMSKEEVILVLKGMDISELKRLNASISIPFPVSSSTSKRFLVYKLAAACFSQDIDLDPEEFFWLGKWKRLPNGDYQEL